MSNQSQHFNTKIKLEIFEEYLIKWIPTFIKKHKWEKILIHDFFAGEGKDSKENPGSPLIILKVLEDKYKNLIEEKDIKIEIVLNEKDKTRYLALKNNISSFSYNNKEKITIKIHNKDFKKLFNELHSQMLESTHLPRLIFLDQFGIKEVTKEIFEKLTGFERTDFIFFISSSYIKRFGQTPEFKKYLEIEKEKLEESRPFHCHRVIFDYYKSLIKTDYRLAPFSIKKGGNIYGLIFGSNHTLGLEKFLQVGWKINPNTGDANYNIDKEPVADGLLSMFPEHNIPKKIDLLNEKIEESIKKKNLTLYELYIITLEFGCLPKHCNNLLETLEKNEKIEPVQTKKNRNIHELKKANVIVKCTDQK